MIKKVGPVIFVLSVLWAVTSLTIRGGVGWTSANAGPTKLCDVLNITDISDLSGFDDVYSVGYYNLAVGSGISDNTLRILNPGTDFAGTECANIYVFDGNQNMLDCCSCPVTANGLLTLSVKNDLLHGSFAVKSGVIEVVASDPDETCDASGPYDPFGGLVGWLVHGSGSSGTEVELKPTSLGICGTSQIEALQSACDGVRACNCPATAP
jgi:hypothetical protein